MRIVTKLLGLWAIGRTVTSTAPLFVRLATSIAAIAFLSMFILMLVIAVIIVLLWSVYLQLASMGIDPLLGKLIVLLIVVLLILAAGMIIQTYIHKIRTNVRAIVLAQAPISGRVSMVADAFIRGFSR